MINKIQDAMRDRHIPNMARLSNISVPTWRKMLRGDKVNTTTMKRAAQYLGIEWEGESSGK